MKSIRSDEAVTIRSRLKRVAVMNATSSMRCIAVKARYDYSGRRIRYDALLPAREGYFLFKSDGEMELWLSAIVTTDDNREYQMVMNAQKK